MIDNAIEFYYKAIELKDLIRAGYIQWKVDKERIESVAEHVFACQILAIGLYSELKLDLDLGKVLEMLAIHELEEIAIGDVTPLDDTPKSSLKKKAREEVQKMIENLERFNILMSLTDEYNKNETKEAQFSKAVDKLECVLQMKKYHDEERVSVLNATPSMLKNKKLKEYMDSGKYDLADIFFLFHMPSFQQFGITEEYWFKTLKHFKIR